MVLIRLGNVIPWLLFRSTIVIHHSTVVVVSSTTTSRIGSNSVIHRRDLQQQDWNITGDGDDAEEEDDSTTVEYRSVLVVRILEESDSSSDSSSLHHTQLDTILFNGNATYMTTTTSTGIEINTTGTSVAQQFSSCSMGKMQLLPLSSHSNGHIWDIVIDDDTRSSMVTDRNDRSQWISAAASTAYNLGFLAADTENDNSSESDRTAGLRDMAHHVIVILPPNYPNENNEFLASAEVNHSISVFASTLTNSLSMYMHELGHNIFLQHAGGLDPEHVYGDKTGYMGTSEGSSHFPHKCYNAAQQWQLNWYGPHRLSLLPQIYKNDNSKWSGRIQVNAFVDALKLETSNNDQVVMVQVDSNTYLQFNRAKMYNIGTPMMANEIVIVRELVSNTQLLKGMNMTNYYDSATYQYESNVIDPSNNKTITTDIMIQLCDIVIHDANAGFDDDSNIDYAIIAIGFNSNNKNDETTLCQSNFITDTTYTGSGIPIYLTNSTKGGPKIDLDDILTNIYELNVLLLILIGCTIVLLIGWIIKLFFMCIIRYCCCGCQCIGGGSKTSDSTNASISDGSATALPQHQPVVSVDYQQTIPQSLPKDQQPVSKRGGKSWLSRLFVPQRRRIHNNNNNSNHQQRQRDDTESTETTPSHNTSELPVATIVQIY